MSYFPFFIDISDKSCIVVGGGNIALQKVLKLIQFDVNITVIAPYICEELLELKSKYKSDSKNNTIVLFQRKFEDSDIQDAQFVVAATDDSLINSHISYICKEKGILVNVVDVKHECTFFFPAIIKQQDLVVAISTGGNSPAMASKIKKDIENTIPKKYVEIIEFLGDHRDYIRNEISNLDDRKKIYEEIIELAEKSDMNLIKDRVHMIVNKYTNT